MRLLTSVCGLMLAGLSVCSALCVPPGVSLTDVTIGDDTHVCVAFNDRVESYITPEADAFSRVQYNGSFLAMPDGAGTILNGGGWQPDMATPSANASLRYFDTITVSSLNGTSLPRVYRQTDLVTDSNGNVTSTVYVWPLLTAVVHVVDGRVDALTWDDGCFFCDENGDLCKFNAMDPSLYKLYPEPEFRGCAETVTSCSTEDESNSCDLKLYVVWTGTDANGDFFRSAGLRFSRFRSFGLSSLYSSARKTGNKGINGAGRAV